MLRVRIDRLRIVALAIALLVTGTARASAEPAPLKIGLIYSYTGAPGYLGKGIDASIAAYMALHGDRIAGRKVVIIRRDDTGIAPDIARRMAQELIVQENVDILIGGATTPNAIAIASISTEAKKPYFVINSGTSGILTKNPYSVRFGWTTAQITTPFAAWVRRNGIGPVYLMYQEYGPGIDAGAAFRKSFEAEGGTIAGESRVPITNLDYGAYIQRVRDSKAQGLFAFNNYVGGLQMLKAAYAAGLYRDGIKILSPLTLIEESQIANYPDLTVGLISAGNYTYSHDSALNRHFMAAWQKAYGSTTQVPEFGDCATWDIMSAIYRIAAMQHGALDPDKTIAAVRGMRFESPRGPLLIDPDTRDAVQNAYIRRIERRADGRIVDVEIATIPMTKDPNEH